MMQVMENIISMLVTGNGKITCKRCTAKSKRSGEQCGKPALKSSRTQKCEFHGGRSTGPKTEAGKARQRAAVLKTGDYTKEAMEDKARSVRVLAGLEDAMYVLNMTTIPRSRGRKPLGYVPLQTVEDVVKFALDNPLRLLDGSAERQKK
jgi:hypothetical protein